MYDFPQVEAGAREAIEADAARVKADALNRVATKAKADALDAERQARKANPERYYGWHRDGKPIVYAPLPVTVEGPTKPKSRALEIDGVNLEHVSTDVDGVWIYREM
jgi:hypothetical protein